MKTTQPCMWGYVWGGVVGRTGQGSGVAHLEFSVLHEMVESVSVDARLTGVAHQSTGRGEGAHSDQVLATTNRGG